MDEKEKALEELSGKQEEKPVKKKKRGGYKDKPVAKWHCNDLLNYFASRYYQHLGVPYPGITMKDRKQAKQLLEAGDFDILDIVRMIDYFIKNYYDLKNVPKEAFPTWNIFFGFRNSVIPEIQLALKGQEIPSKGNFRQYQEPGEEEKWVPDSWE